MRARGLWGLLFVGACSFGIATDGKWKAITATDMIDNPEAVKLQRSTDQAGAVIHIALQPGGGYVAGFTRE